MRLVQEFVMNPLKELLWRAKYFTAYKGFYFAWYRPIDESRYQVKLITKLSSALYLYKFRFKSQTYWKLQALKEITKRPDFRLTVTQYNARLNYVLSQSVILNKDVTDEKLYRETLRILQAPETQLIYQVHSRIDGSLIGTPEDAYSLIRNHLKNARLLKNTNKERGFTASRACIAQRVLNGKFESWVIFDKRRFKSIKALSENEAHLEAQKALEKPLIQKSTNEG